MKILCILYDDPKDGMPSSYPLKELPKLDKYPDGMTLPSPKGRDFTPGELLGCVSGELGLRKFLEDGGHTLVVTSGRSRIFHAAAPAREPQPRAQSMCVTVASIALVSRIARDALPRHVRQFADQQALRGLERT